MKQSLNLKVATWENIGEGGKGFTTEFTCKDNDLGFVQCERSRDNLLSWVVSKFKSSVKQWHKSGARNKLIQ